MASERLLFMGMILAVMGFLAWLVWLRYEDKWRQEKKG